MLGTVVNFFAVIAGSLLGMMLKKGIPQRMGDAIMNGIALCVIYIGIDGALEGGNVLIAILSMAIGTVVGELLNLDGHINNLGLRLERFVNAKSGENTVAKGFVTATLLYCVGAMAVVGSLQSGLTGNHETLFAKSLMDGITAVVLTASMGVGVAFSSVAVFVYQGIITLLAHVVSPVLTETVINEMTCVGSLLIVGIGLNMMKITNLKIMNYIPAVFMPILLCMIIK